MGKAINLQSNYPVLAEQDAEWSRLLHGAVDRFAAESLRLPAFGGSMENRRLAAAWLGMLVERVFIAEAGHHGLLASVMAAGLVGKTIAVEALTYPWFVRQAQMLGCRLVPVALDSECMMPEALRAVCEREEVAAVYTMPSLHNPTGAVASLERREAMVAVAREFELVMIEDGAYGFLLADEPARYVTLAPERAFYVESLSKRVAPGLRTAFVVAPERFAAETELALRVIGSGSSTLLASLGCAMAADGSLAAVIEAKRVEGARRSAMAVETLPGLEMMAGANSWHIWVTLPVSSGLTAESCEAMCEERGVLVTGAHWFTAPGAEVARAVRLGLGGETEWERVAEGLRVFAEIVRR
jgi:DNA-binding transcriptional MocR family regulator